MDSENKRKLFKGRLRPPKTMASNLSYTQMPASQEEICVRRSSKEEIKVVEFSSRAIPQPFLDPSILQRRIQADKEWENEQAKKQEET